MHPSFIITIDTEGDNSWQRRREVSTKNAGFVQRFQALAEANDLKPTWLTNYEMARNDGFQEFGTDVIQRSTGEVGMHLHAWHSPPFDDLTGADHRHHPFLIEYDLDVMRRKIECMTELLQNRFGVRPVSHRAGRWATNHNYFQVLRDSGYLVDCSSTPGVSWTSTKGSPNGSGGTDYTRWPQKTHWVASCETLMQVPMTVVSDNGWLRRMLPPKLANLRGIRGLLKRFAPQQWLRPGYANNLIDVAERALKRGDGHLEFMLHSSELMPGGSPNFPTDESVESMYRQTEELFRWTQGRCVGRTLSEHYDSFHDQLLE